MDCGFLSFSSLIQVLLFFVWFAIGLKRWLWFMTPTWWLASGVWDCSQHCLEAKPLSVVFLNRSFENIDPGGDWLFFAGIRWFVFLGENFPGPKSSVRRDRRSTANWRMFSSYCDTPPIWGSGSLPHLFPLGRGILECFGRFLKQWKWSPIPP